MYLPTHFTEIEREKIDELMLANPLAALVAQGPDGLIANHIPLLKSREMLIGHIAANNMLHQQISDGTPVMAIFRGDHSYISPNWYPSKPLHHKHVPTWNYQVVHVHGALRFLHDPQDKRRIVGRLTKHFELATNGDAQWRMSDAPEDYMQTMLENIVGFEIDITKIEAKSKLSQNRDAVDYDGVVEQMEARGQDGLAQNMRRLKSNAD